MSVVIERTLPFVVTDAGRDKAASVAGGGLALKLTHIAVGAGNLVPTASSTALHMERMRAAIVSYVKPEPYVIEAQAQFVTDETFLATEVGVYSEETLVAAGYRADGLVPVGPGIPYTFSGLLVLAELPANTTVEINGEVVLDLAFIDPLVALARAVTVLQRLALDHEIRIRRLAGNDTAGLTRFGG